MVSLYRLTQRIDQFDLLTRTSYSDRTNSSPSTIIMYLKNIYKICNYSCLRNHHSKSETFFIDPFLYQLSILKAWTSVVLGRDYNTETYN